MQKEKSLHVIEGFAKVVQEPRERNLNGCNCTFRRVTITEQKMANPCMPRSPFHTELFYSTVIQLGVTNK